MPTFHDHGLVPLPKPAPRLQPGVNILDLHVEVDGVHEDRYVALVPSADDVMVGTCAVRCGLHTAQIRQLFVHPSYRRRGVASALVNRCIEHLTRAGFVSVALHVAKANAAVLPFYEKLGFELRFEYDDGDMVLSRNLT